MNGLTVLLIVVVFVFLFLLFLVSVAVVAFGVYRMMRAKKQARIDQMVAPLVDQTNSSNVSFGEIALDLGSIDITDGLDDREKAIIAKYTKHLCKLVTKQVVEDSAVQAEETIAKALTKKTPPQPAV